MNVRYRVPCDFYFSLRYDAGTTPVPEPKDYALPFKFHGHKVTVTPASSHLLTIWHEVKSGKNAPIYRVLEVSFQIQDDRDCHLEKMCAGAEWVELAQLLIGITNHALLNIRVHGGITSLHAIPTWIPSYSSGTTASPFILAEMNIETTANNGTSWTPLSCGWKGRKEAKELRDFVLGIPMAGSLNVKTWMQLENVLGEGKTPDVARVCLANAKEGAVSGDGRTAVLEAVFALELLVNRILAYYCATLFPDKDLNVKNVGFPEKILLALPKAVEPYWDLHLQKYAAGALSAIRDRNDVSHRGDLRPERAGTEKLWDDFRATVALVETLLRDENIIKQRIDHLAKPEGKVPT